MHRVYIRSILASILVYLVPLAATAAPSTFRDLVDNYIIDIVNNAVIPLIFALAFITFIFGVFQYFFFPSENNKTRGRDFIVWGLLGMFVMVSVWGLVNIVVNSFFPCTNPSVFGCFAP